MARICARCRQPLDPRERPDDHLCVDDDEPAPDTDGMPDGGRRWTEP
jgi:hypothetical protein